MRPSAIGLAFALGLGLLAAPPQRAGSEPRRRDDGHRPIVFLRRLVSRAEAAARLGLYLLHPKAQPRVGSLKL